ncbi:hypothetical protein WICPIJ_007181 [Wickerhamomyces pijperi]|uniref:Uncharacterized protein n=1 Tax=Wickerhamomyces pijperi TaxID=599730 RepID=A0A9P8TKC0_WICPI|nr:hypothetical protein WICPIJ_007181 [Wickerhamomyces pijperi]
MVLMAKSEAVPLTTCSAAGPAGGLARILLTASWALLRTLGLGSRQNSKRPPNPLLGVMFNEVLFHDWMSWAISKVSKDPMADLMIGASA